MDKTNDNESRNIFSIAIILLLGSFLYFFEIFYHGFVHSDFNRTQILLTVLTFALSAGFVFYYLYLEKKIQLMEFREFSGFFIVSVVFLFLIFFTRNMSAIIPFTFAGIYFLLALSLTGKKARSLVAEKVDLNSPMIRFSLRFFIILGLMILPASIYEYSVSGTIDFRFHSIALPLINMITPIVESCLKLIGFDIISIPQEGGTTLSLADNSFSVFVGILCSGITSLSVFIAAFIALALDLKTTLPKKTIMLVIGIAGTVASNILRITALFLVGYYWGSEAMTFMHTHLGWILYFLWITIFWSLAFHIAKKDAASYDESDDKTLKSNKKHRHYSYKP